MQESSLDRTVMAFLPYLARRYAYVSARPVNGWPGAEEKCGLSLLKVHRRNPGVNRTVRKREVRPRRIGAIAAQATRKGKAIAAGSYSLLLRVVLQSADRTLTEDELARNSESIVATLTTLGGTQRA